MTDSSPKDIVDCTVDYLSGVYSCGGGSAFFSRKGTAELIEVTINGENANKVKELSIGDRLEIGARVVKTGNDKCLKVSVSPDSLQPVYTGITINGTSDIAPVLVTDSLSVTGRRGEIIAKGMLYSIISQNNQNPVYISVKFFDEDRSRYYGTGDKAIIDKQEIQLGETKEYQIDNTKIKVSGTTITVEKENVVLDIRDVNYIQTQAGTYELQEVITVNPNQQTTPTTQQKTILVELLHIKEDRGSFNNVDDCSLNDKIVERKYTITVGQDKGIDSRKLGPVISISPVKSTIIGQKVSIVARITHQEGISEATITITAPDGTDVVEDQAMGKFGDNFDKIFETDGREKGRYKGVIKATSRAETKSEKTFEFELKEPN